MAKYTKKEFALLCGIKTKTLSVYIGRDQVLVGDDEKIDAALEINKYFVEQRQVYNSKNKTTTETTPKPETETATTLDDRSANQQKEVQAKFKFPTEHAPSPSRNFQLDEQIKTQSLEKEKISSALLKAKLDKISGDTIPTELVKNLFMHHSKSITVAFQHGAENLLSKIAKLKGIDINEMAALRTELIEIINTAVNNSIETSKKTVASIVAEHSQRKEVGERE